MAANSYGTFTPFVFGDSARQACSNALQTFFTEMKPELISLTDDQRASQKRIGPKDEVFSDKGLAYGRSNPELLPATVDIDEYQNDTDCIEALTPYLQAFTLLVAMIQDTMSRARDRRFGRASVFYSNVKICADLNMPGAATIRDDMGIAFARPGRRKSVTTPPPAPAPAAE